MDKSTQTEIIGHDAKAQSLQKSVSHRMDKSTQTEIIGHDEVYVNQVCMQVFNRFPDFVQQSKHAAFETISDPKYSGKMKKGCYRGIIDKHLILEGHS
ncbi:UNVERIFIED_CONTAM: hypothetical protein FKN15_015026 [Acipenser sinensis]